MTVNANGICYDLAHSPYEAARNGLVFRFSSPLHMRRFMEKAKEREDWACDSLSRRFKCRFDARLLADLQLYEKVETRGFYIYDPWDGEVYRSWQEVSLAGVEVRRTESEA